MNHSAAANPEIMNAHVFVDESKNRRYLVAAAFLMPDRLANARKRICELQMPGQRRVHFTKERDSRRREILSAICGFSPVLRLYHARSIPNLKAARDACLERLVDDLAETDARMLVLERDDSVVDKDRRLIAHHAAKVGYPNLRYVHLRAHEEPLLAIPDAVAWCWVKGGEWRQRVEPLVCELREL